ncbi:MAG: GNAT family N-acetyltransferase [Defluviitaleaceae bacterium]|nr:GNAT family N-acetyltransferase [Defluviitaleaceae bacterium]
MNITQRRYKILTDFERVYRFLQETYDPVTLNSYLLPQYFEYAHMHSHFDYFKTHRFELWEDGGNVVSIVCYEMKMGDCHMHVRKGYEALLPEMLTWAEKELSVAKEGKESLKVWITDKETGKQEMLKARGYAAVYTDGIMAFDYAKPFSQRALPEGFTLIDGTNVDHLKLRRCWWKGFNHEGEPDDDSVDGTAFLCNAPRADMWLMTVVVAPDGEYACALGMWFDEANKYAYLEPLATVPKYRRLGLAEVALTEAMKKTKELGAKYCFGGDMEFYAAIGFETVCNRELWEREW